MNTNKNRQAVIVGIFIFIGLVIVLFAALFLGGQHQSFEKTITLYTVFDDVEGLKVGDNVWYAGVKVGVVRHTTFTPDAKVQINMKIQDDAEKYIHKDSKARISSDGLMGNKIIIIYGGSVTSSLVVDEDFLATEKTYGAKDMLNILDSSNRNLMAISTNIKGITDRMLHGNGTISALLNDSAISRNIRNEIASFEATLHHFRQTAAKSAEVVDNFAQFSAQFNKEGSLVNDLVTDTIIYNNLRSTVSQLREATYNLATFSGNLSAASENLHDANSPAGVLLNDKEVAARLMNIMRNLDSASYRLNEDLEAVQHNFLLKGYFKKKEKEQQP